MQGPKEYDLTTTPRSCSYAGAGAGGRHETLFWASGSDTTHHFSFLRREEIFGPHSSVTAVL